MPVTQKDIAAHLGVSQPLVAQALNGNPKVAESTRLRVLEAARELGYDARDNAAARSLIARRHGNRVKTGAVAVLMGDFMDGLALQDMPFFREILQGIHAEAARENLDVAIHILRPGNLPRAVLTGGVDGAICVYSFTISQDLVANNVTIPLVRLGEPRENAWAIVPDDVQGTYQTTLHLLELGHRHIGYMGSWDRSRPSTTEDLRYSGYVRALTEYGVEVDPTIIVDRASPPSQSSGREHALEFLQRVTGVTALVCSHDSLALGAIEAAHALGLKVPEDLSVTGFDGAGAGYGGSSTLTTAFFDRRVMGRRALEVLALQSRTPPAEPEVEVLPTRLWIRDSTAPPVTLKTPEGTMPSFGTLPAHPLG